MNGAWPWLVLAGLGAFHGLNPAMGWLFAVALGLHRHSRGAVLAAIVPIGVGHLLAIAVVVAIFVASQYVLDPRWVGGIAGVVLIAWAIYYVLTGHPRRVRFGMQTSMLGLGVWSFLMATAHGAGLMLIPALMPLCLPAEATSLGNTWAVAIAGVVVHTGAMLATTAAIALAVHEWIGVGILRSAWINLDALWIAALASIGGYLVFESFIR